MGFVLYLVDFLSSMVMITNPFRWDLFSMWRRNKSTSLHRKYEIHSFLMIVNVNLRSFFLTMNLVTIHHRLFQIVSLCRKSLMVIMHDFVTV